MIRDALTTFMEDEAFAANVAEGAIDLYGAAIAVYPDSNLREKNGRGDGSVLAIDIVIKRGGTGTTAFSGTATATIYMDDTDGLTTAIQTNVILGTDAEHDGVHARVFVPANREGRYLGVGIDDTSLVGGGSANVVDAWVGPL